MTRKSKSGTPKLANKSILSNKIMIKRNQNQSLSRNREPMRYTHKPGHQNRFKSRSEKKSAEVREGKKIIGQDPGRRKAGSQQ